MGHTTHTSFVSLQAAATAHEALHTAAQIWRDEEANRYDSESLGHFSAQPLMTRLAAQRSISSDDDQFFVSSGRSVVIPVCSEADTVVKTQTVKLTLNRDQLKRARSGDSSVLQQIARAEHGATVTAVEVVSLPKPRKPKATATDGSMKTVYKIVGANFIQQRDLRESYNTLAEARADAIAFMEKHPTCQALSVRAEVIRDSGRDLLVIDRPEPDTAVVTVKITTHTPKPGAKQDGWVVAFDYHH